MKPESIRSSTGSPVKPGHLILAAVLASTILSSAAAAELRIGRANEPQSMDPQFSRTGNNQMTALHVFDRLTLTDENIRMNPALAVSWKNLDPRTWEIKLRAGVKFHDGSPFTAEDVVFSLERAPKVPNSPASFAESVKNIERMQVMDPLTIRFTSKEPDPLFIENIGTVYIVSRRAAEKAVNADFNSGKAAIGTGPYKFVSWKPGDRLELVRNEAYWGSKPQFDKVSMRFISNDAARVAALLSNSVDLIDLVPPGDLPRLKADPNIHVHEVASLRLVYLALNQRKDLPLLTDLQGKPLPANPLTDVRVRKAISLMLDRNALTSRILQGQGAPASQIVPQGVFGYNPELKVKPADLKEAKKLLAEAGYPNGFGITIHGSNDRFLLDREIAQGVGQLLARGGIKVNKVETLPYSVYTKDALRGAYAAFIFSYGNTTGEASRGLESLFHSVDAQRNQGSLNRTLYSNQVFDWNIDKATQEFAPKKREQLVQDAARRIEEDAAFIPLYFQSVTWASRKNIAFKPRKDERTLAMSASPAR
jgi:peptide/nickel transport system substrate-binding protein